MISRFPVPTSNPSSCNVCRQDCNSDLAMVSSHGIEIFRLSFEQQLGMEENHQCMAMFMHPILSYFHIFNMIQPSIFGGIILSHSEMNGRSCRVQTYRCLSPQKNWRCTSKHFIFSTEEDLEIVEDLPLFCANLLVGSCGQHRIALHWDADSSTLWLPQEES